MRIPTISGVIDRRILTNYRIDPEVMARLLPTPFRPKLVRGYAIGGVCLIRLTKIRPSFLPSLFGIQSENGAHRIAVEWDAGDETREGVFITRRDTDSRLNALAGGRVFPGKHHLASFKVEETSDRYSVCMRSQDAATSIDVCGRVADHFPSGSVFDSLAEASAFFEAGSLGYSAARSQRREENRFEGLELSCTNWDVQTLKVECIESSYFDDRTYFPNGSVEFDCALLMRGIEHHWRSGEELCCARSG